MKRLILLVSFLMLSLNTFSQTDTTHVTIPLKTARLVVQDLIKYDGCIQELELNHEKIKSLEYKDSQKDTIINLLNKKDQVNINIIKNQESQIIQHKGINGELIKEIKTQKHRVLRYQILALLGMALAVYFY